MIEAARQFGKVLKHDLVGTNIENQGFLQTVFALALSLLLARLQSPEHAGRLGVIAELAPHQLDGLQPPVRGQG